MINVRGETTNVKGERCLTFHVSRLTKKYDKLFFVTTTIASVTSYLPSSLLQYSSEPNLKRKGIPVTFSTCSSFLQKKPKQPV